MQPINRSTNRKERLYIAYGSNLNLEQMENRCPTAEIVGATLLHRKMKAYGEREHGGKYILEDYTFSRNHRKARTIRRWWRLLKKKARQKNRRELKQIQKNIKEVS